jgi:hypothetical protein
LDQSKEAAWKIICPAAPTRTTGEIDKISSEETDGITIPFAYTPYTVSALLPVHGEDSNMYCQP